MKNLLLSILVVIFILISVREANCQVIEDPLLHYYSLMLSASDQNKLSTFKVYCFEAHFPNKTSTSIFITDTGNYLGAHGKYAWSVYCPIDPTGFRIVSDDSHFLESGLLGPNYIGYIDELNRFGIVNGSRDGIYGLLLENGVLTYKEIDHIRPHADFSHYPKYFPDKWPDYHIRIYSMAQLQEKYPHTNPSNITTPSSK